MYNIKLICTKHNEIGKCNSKKLLRLIEKSNPTVIFEELSPITYRECYELGRKTTESVAIKMYIEQNSVKHIPVVNTEISDDVVEKFKINSQHRYNSSIMHRLQFLTYKHGFNFLNSSFNDKIYNYLKRLEQEIVENTHDNAIQNIYKRANQNIDSYENDIVENVYKYSAENRYDKALMFIGSAHRKSIIEKIIRYSESQDLKLNWSFYDGETQTYFV